MRVNDRATAGTSLQARCGLRFLLSATRLDGSITAKANAPGMAAPSVKLSLASFMGLSLQDREPRGSHYFHSRRHGPSRTTAERHDPRERQRERRAPAYRPG